jgi:hypothetical protein
VTQRGVIEMGSRRELFVDDLMIDRLEGRAARRLHHPVPREVVIVHDRPWEGCTSGYHSIFRDGEIYRMYYRGSAGTPEVKEKPHPQFACYAESRDGIHWEKPELDLIEFEGSKANNIIWHSHNFTAFRDARPDCPPEAVYKGLSSIRGGLQALCSPDGIRWSPMRDEPVITDGRFDSQNLAFWDSARGVYRAYYRDLRPGENVLHDAQRTRGARDIKTAISQDFLNWQPQGFLDYGPGAPLEHLYTNQVQPYCRAPHILLGFPTRFLADRGSTTEGLLMSSRDGRTFERWEEALIRPGLNPARWGNRSNYIWWGIVETASGVPGTPDELSIYSIEGYYEGQSDCVRRFTYRVDGFVSVHAPFAGGRMLTCPLIFDGDRLAVNVSTSAAGSLRVEMQDAGGTPIDGFRLADCDEIYGDDLNRVVTWNGNANLGRLASRSVRLLAELADADLYAVEFPA